MFKYFLPPLISWVFFFISLTLMDTILRPRLFFSLEFLFASIYMVFFTALLAYPFILSMHLIGCIFIRLTKKFKFYSLPLLLILGLFFGVTTVYLLDPIASMNHLVIIIGGIAGMVNCLIFYYLDKTEKSKKPSFKS